MLIIKNCEKGVLVTKKSKPNYELKAKAIAAGYCRIEREISLTRFKRFKLDAVEAITGEVADPYEKAKLEDKLNNCNTFESMLLENEETKILYEEARKINQASYKRRERLAQRIGKMINNHKCIFLTLTFDDLVLEKTSVETRRKYVTRFLKNISNDYVANVDFGALNEREHYHALVICDLVNHDDWSYGLINFERVREASSEKALAKYICKLVNHAIKETTKRNYTIYSKK